MRPALIEAVEAIRLEIEGPLATLILDRPRVLNAGNRQWVTDLNEDSRTSSRGRTR
jgi:hypothetical protein